MAASTRVGYAIQTHANPRQIERLVLTLVRRDPTGFVHLSHDRKGPELPASLRAHPSVHVSLDEGGRGRFHNVDRWLGAARWFRDHEEVDYLVTLTGQDYPVRPLEELHSALRESGDGLMEYFPVLRAGGNWPLREGRLRYLYSWHEVRRISPAAKNRLRPLLVLNRVQPFVRVNVAYDSLRLATRTRHPLPPGWEPWGGSFFTNLSWRAVAHVLAASENAQLMTWARRSLLIEEAFFQTILLNAGTFTFGNSSGRYYDFAGAQHGSPATLGADDVPKALASEQFFARKWDPEAGPELYGLLDEALTG